uniref:hypothetical protein n=1 Tax=Amycolatopsis sp. CA-293810 TaxID=3239926 RepID=UPI003F49B1B9
MDSPPLLPWAITHWPVLEALNNYDGLDEAPTVFNRHATAYAVGQAQYSRANALIATMLATSVLREAHHVDVTVRDLKDETKTM